MISSKSWGSVGITFVLMVVIAAPALGNETNFNYSYGGNTIEYVENTYGGKCGTLYFQNKGSSWQIVPSIASDGWKKLIRDENLERLSYCFTVPSSSNPRVEVGVFTTFTSQVESAGRQGHSYVNYSRPYKCAISRFKKDGPDYFRTYPRDRDGGNYLACNSTFKGNIGFSLSYTETTPWLDKAAVLTSIQSPESKSFLHTEFINYLNNEQSSLAASKWLSQYGVFATKDQLRQLIPAVAKEDIVEEFAKVADSELTNEALVQTKTYWMNRYRSGWSGSQPNQMSIDELRKYVSMSPYTEGQMKFSSTDFDSVAPVAKRLLEERERIEAVKAKEIALEEAAQARQEAIRHRELAAQDAAQKRELAAQLNKWRKSLRIGDDTFCGPVIEVRQPMIKIALNAQLPGYGNEAWLKMSEIFPASAGCRNYNGHLSPNN